MSAEPLPSSTGLEPGQEAVALAVVGLGAIGGEVARAVLEGQTPGVVLRAAVEPRPGTGAETVRRYGVPVVGSVDELTAQPIDVVLEAASQAVLREIATQVLAAGRDLIAMSAGAVLDAAFVARLLETAAASGRRIWLPSGGIGGLDALRAAAAGDIECVHLTTTKPPRALADAPYVSQQGIDLVARADARSRRNRLAHDRPGQKGVVLLVLHGPDLQPHHLYDPPRAL